MRSCSVLFAALWLACSSSTLGDGPLSDAPLCALGQVPADVANCRCGATGCPAGYFCGYANGCGGVVYCMQTPIIDGGPCAPDAP